MDDTQAMNHESSDVDRNSAGGAVPEGDEAEQPDQPTVDDWTDDEAESTIDVGILVSHSPGGDVEPLRSVAERMARDGVEGLAAATDAAWRIHCVDPDPLAGGTENRIALRHLALFGDRP